MNIRYKYIAVSLLMICLAAIIFGWLPAYVEKTRNNVQAVQHTKINAKTNKLHQSLFIADLHSDSLLWNRDLAKKSDYGHVDIPRLIEGNIGLQVFSAVTKTPKNLNLLENSADTDNISLLAFAQLWPPKTWFSLVERATYQAEKLQKFAEHSANHFYLIKNQQNFKNYLQLRKGNPHITAGLLSLEGAHALEGKLENVDRLYQAGFRIIGLTHFFDNELGGSAHGINKDGITAFGKQVLKRMDELNLFVDLSHASPRLFEDVLNLSNRPILVTHTGVQAICSSKSTRNLSNKQIKQLAQFGGIIGVGFWPTATCNKGLEGIVQTIRHIRDLIGIDYVGLGSDFDGNVVVPFTSSNIIQLTHELLQAGFTEAEIRKVMGENVEQLFLQYLPNS